jgi:predicted nucleotidyltransferase
MKRSDEATMELDQLTSVLTDFLIRQPEVSLAYLFGSQAQGRAHSLSDVDVAVLLAEQFTPAEQSRARLHLLGELMALLQREDVDLVVLNQASLLLRHRVLRDGRLLFANDDRARVRFAAETYRRYLDCRYMYDMLDEAMFARLREGRFGRGQVGASRSLRQARTLHRQSASGA